MKVKTIKNYKDLERNVISKVGEEFEVTNKRAQVLIEKGFVVAVEEAVEETKEEIKTKAKKKKKSEEE